MDKLSLREELIVTNVDNSKFNLGDDKSEGLLPNRTDWQLQIKPLYPDEGTSLQQKTPPCPLTPASLCVATLPSDGEGGKLCDDQVMKPGGVAYPCSACNISFSSQKYMEQHLKWCRGVRAKLLNKGQDMPTKRFSCDQCAYSTDVSSHLTTHVRRHTGEKPYACTLCPYRASESCTLNRHKLAHSGVRPHPCPICPYRANFAGDLQKHVRTHTGEKPFLCGRCPYRASRPGSLKEHMMTHGGPKPFTCSECSYRAVSSGHLKKHTKSHLRGTPTTHT